MKTTIALTLFSITCLLLASCDYNSAASASRTSFAQTNGPPVVKKEASVSGEQDNPVPVEKQESLSKKQVNQAEQKRASKYGDGLLGVKFGMTKQEVQRLYPSGEWDDDGDYKVYSPAKQFVFSFFKFTSGGQCHSILAVYDKEFLRQAGAGDYGQGVLNWKETLVQKYGEAYTVDDSGTSGNDMSPRNLTLKWLEDAGVELIAQVTIADDFTIVKLQLSDVSLMAEAARKALETTDFGLDSVSAPPKADALQRTEKKLRVETPQSETVSMKNKTAALRVRDTVLVAEYARNEFKADEKYKGKVIEVTGVYEEIGERFDLDSSQRQRFARIRSSDDLIDSVKCVIDDEAASGIRDLNTGDLVTVKGLCRGKAGQYGGIIFRHCVFSK